LSIDVVHVPVCPDFDSPHWPEIDAIGAAAPDYTAATEAVYLEFLQRFHERFTRAVIAVARSREGALVIHCAGGKDRTGLVVALLLRLASAQARDVAVDYAPRGDNIHDESSKWIAEAEDETEHARRRRVAVAPGESVVAVRE